MKSISRWVLLPMLAASPAFSASYTVSGTISLMRSHDSTMPGLDWFSVSGGASAGTCGVVNGLVVIRIADDERGWRHFAMLASAKGKGLSVNVSLDDTVKDAWGYCILRFVEY